MRGSFKIATSRHRQPAIHVNGLPGDVSGLGPEQEQRWAHDVVHLADSPEWDVA